jgi:hypothetical protein
MTEFIRREAALRRIEYVVRPPDPEIGEKDYDRYEEDRALAARLIHEEAAPVIPYDLRVIEGEAETLVTYEQQRVVIREETREGTF